ncbi:helix-turn-helix domain-containing protein [Ningiella sp. W23]|uniref:helix-turn-helix domain-containing protein n=1 Tax=Ningiella sp. W23 TaxID=3023715 RepID=UPI0037575E75
MMLRVGISRQQYQRLESKGNPRLDTLELVAQGLKSELLLIPQEKLDAVLALLTDDNPTSSGAPTKPSQTGKKLWPEALKRLPMDEAHKQGLRSHWTKLHDDFKIQATK